MVEFFKTSIACKAIKYILSQIALPLCKTITSDEFIFEGCTYVYKDKLIKCTKSGRFQGLNSSLTYDDHLYVNEHLTVSDDIDYIQRRGDKRNPYGDLDKWDFSNTITATGEPITPPNPIGIGGLKKSILLSNTYYDDYITVTDDVVKQFLRPFAEVEIIQDFTFGEFIPGLTYYYQANSNYYDTETHYYLGEYLRCLRDIKGMDLMSLYNCFNYNYVDNVGIVINDINTKTYLTDECPKDKKITLIPIKFNKTYTIATSCPYKIEAKSVFYKDMLMRDLNDSKYVCEDLNESYVTFNNLQFEKPETYQINIDNKQLLDYEKYLYLALQVPKNHNEPIVVLEGDYTHHADRHVCDVASIQAVSEAQLSRVFKSKLSLLMNTGKQKPFADVLLQYLFDNTIDSRDYIDENITRIEDKVMYYPRFNGHWSTTLRYILYDRYMSSNDPFLDKTDILGFVDSKIENAVNKGLIING